MPSSAASGGGGGGSGGGADAAAGAGSAGAVPVSAAASSSSAPSGPAGASRRRGAAGSGARRERAEAAPPKPGKDWKFTQWFKKMPSQGMLPDADVLSAVEFDQTGSFLATGDRGGRIVVLEFDGRKKKDADDEEDKKHDKPAADKGKRSKPQPAIHYKFHCEFQSHDPEFDYVKSLAIDERINKIRWLRPTNNARYMLSTNDKVVKLWKIYEKELKMVTNLNAVQSPQSATRLVVPTLEATDSFVISEPRRFFANVHEFAINSLSPNTDGETFLTADNLRINLWNLEMYDQSFNLVDMKPADPMEQLIEVVTCAEFHPQHCSTFMYSSNLGTVRLADMRDRAVCDGRGRTFGPTNVVFRNQEEKILKEVTQTITDAKFAPSGRYIVTRDYLTVKLWDVNMEKAPVETIQVHDYLRNKLTDLYHNECIFDNFGVSINHRNRILAGGYNNYFHIYDLEQRTDTFVEASKNPLGVVSLAGGPDDGAGGAGTDPDSPPLLHHASSQSVVGGAPPGGGLKKKRSSKSGLGSLLGRKKPSRQNGSKSPRGTPDGPRGRKSLQHLVDINPDVLDYEKKILQVAWHPSENAVAVAGLNNLFIYSQ